MSNFHEVRFPISIALGAKGGPQRRTDIVALSSGAEERNSRWAHSKRIYNVTYGIKTLDKMHLLINFFEGRLGRLYGFRFKDFKDYSSAIPNKDTGFEDQNIGVGDGTANTFQLYRTYPDVINPYIRKITKPVIGTVSIGLGGVLQVENTHYVCDYTKGLITFNTAPATNVQVTAGYDFDVPCRFESDALEGVLTTTDLGQYPNIKILEVRV